MDSERQPLQLEAGTRVGPYEIQGTLGAGGMGTVYRARDPRLERDGLARWRLGWGVDGGSWSGSRHTDGGDTSFRWRTEKTLRVLLFPVMVCRRKIPVRLDT